MTGAATMPELPSSRVRIGRLSVDRMTLKEASDAIAGFVTSRRPHQVATVNVRYLTLADKDPAYAELFNAADLRLADGMPLIWLSRLMGRPVPERITGSDLVRVCCALSAEHGYSIFLLGAAPGVGEEAAARLSAEFPGLKVAGTHHGYFKDDQLPGLVARIRESGASFLFVAMGCPKQDLWIRANAEALGVPVCIGVGGTLEVLTRRLKRAPRWMQKAGLEWFYRLQQEPGRLWRRYLLEDFPTVFRVTGASLARRLSGRV